MANLPARATHQQTRTFNQQLVLRAIYDRSSTSRAEIARVTGLTRTSVSALVGELLRDGLVEEIGTGPSTGGKAPIIVRFRAGGRHVIGLDLAEAAFNGAVVDLRGNVVSSASVALDGRNGQAAVEAVFGLIETLTSRNGASPVLGIGIGAPGLIDSRTGTVRWAVNLDWADLPLGPMVEERFRLPTVVANDSQAAAVAELTFGTVPRPQNLVVVRVGRGVGSGIILDGRLFQGDGSGAGEIGHIVLSDTAGTPGTRDSAAGAASECHCGRHGCLETLASMSAMVRAARRRTDAVSDEASLVRAFRAGDRATREVVEAAGDRLGMGIAVLIGALNVNHVLLIGPATQLGDDWLAAVRRRAESSALSLLTSDTVIELGDAREYDVLIGASALLMTQELGLSLTR